MPEWILGSSRQPVGPSDLLSLGLRAPVVRMFHLGGEKVDWIRNEGNLETGGKLSLSEGGKMDERGCRCESGSETLPCKISHKEPWGRGATSPLITCHWVAIAQKKKTKQKQLTICSEESLAARVCIHISLTFFPIHIQTKLLFVCVKVLYSGPRALSFSSIEEKTNPRFGKRN